MSLYLADKYGREIRKGNVESLFTSHIIAKEALRQLEKSIFIDSYNSKILDQFGNPFIRKQKFGTIKINKPVKFQRSTL